MRGDLLRCKKIRSSQHPLSLPPQPSEHHNCTLATRPTLSCVDVPTLPPYLRVRSFEDLPEDLTEVFASFTWPPPKVSIQR